LDIYILYLRFGTDRAKMALAEVAEINHIKKTKAGGLIEI